MSNLRTFEFPPFVRECQKKAYIHFKGRVETRIGGLDAGELFLAMQDATANREPAYMTEASISYAGRLGRNRPRRLWKLELPDERVFWVIYDDGIDCPITVVAEGLGKTIRCGSRGQKRVIGGKLYVV